MDPLEVSFWLVRLNRMLYSSCDSTCGSASRTRFRRLLSQPIQGGKPCPEVTSQSKPCDYVPCTTWLAENWLSCAPLFGSCGIGIQHRNISCRDEQNNLADRRLCTASVGELTDFFALSEQEKYCRIPCKGQPSKLEWSEWSLCQPKSCRERAQARVPENWKFHKISIKDTHEKSKSWKRVPLPRRLFAL